MPQNIISHILPSKLIEGKSYTYYVLAPELWKEQQGVFQHNLIERFGVNKAIVVSQWRMCKAQHRIDKGLVGITPNDVKRLLGKYQAVMKTAVELETIRQITGKSFSERTPSTPKVFGRQHKTGDKSPDGLFKWIATGSNRGWVINELFEYRVSINEIYVKIFQDGTRNKFPKGTPDRAHKINQERKWLVTSGFIEHECLKRGVDYNVVKTLLDNSQPFREKNTDWLSN